jgi:hypothetical protein
VTSGSCPRLSFFVVAKNDDVFGWLFSGEDVNLVQQLRDLIAVELLHVAQISAQLLHLQVVIHQSKQQSEWINKTSAVVEHANDYHLFVL